MSSANSLAFLYVVVLLVPPALCAFRKMAAQKAGCGPHSIKGFARATDSELAGILVFWYALYAFAVLFCNVSNSMWVSCNSRTRSASKSNEPIGNVPTTDSSFASPSLARRSASSSFSGGTISADLIFLPKNKCKSTTYPSSSFTNNECAMPFLPALATRPTLCTNNFAFAGKS